MLISTRSIACEPAPTKRRVSTYRRAHQRRSEFCRDLRSVLLSVRPEIEHEAPHVLQQMSYRLWLPAAGARRHRDDPTYCYYPARQLEAHFGRGTFKRLNEEHRLFDVLSTDAVRPGSTRGYRLKPDIAEAVNDHLRIVDTQLAPLVTRDGARIRTLPRGIESETAEGTPLKAWAGASVKNLVPINFGALAELSNHLRRYVATGGRIVADKLVPFSTSELDAIRLRNDIATRLLALANTDAGKRRYVPHHFVEATCGRLFATGVNLQSAPREIRAAAFAGMYDYDISSCHWTIAAQLAEREGVECRWIRWYLDHKTAERVALAQRTGISTEDAKACLLALIYGSRSTLWSAADIPQLIGRGAAASLYADEMYRALKDEVARARTAILKANPPRNGRLFNAVGASVPVAWSDGGQRKRLMPAAALAHLTLGLEAKMLRAMVDAFPDAIVQPLHDGFVASEALDTAALERVCFQATGLTMRVERSLIAAPADVRASQDIVIRPAQDPDHEDPEAGRHLQCARTPQNPCALTL